MNRIGAITMTMRELDRLKIIQSLADGNLKPGLAAKRLGLTTRQLLRLLNRFRDEGAAGLIPRSCNRPSNNQTQSTLPRWRLLLFVSGMSILDRRSLVRNYANVTVSTLPKKLSAS
ncbi:MAG: integrase catalytic subunit [Solimicrobium sp.]|jgi:hypothetical protein|nr:integrase catalytic subunit [Solimicrobium sp.]